jgi:manganese oxidase
MVSLVVISYGLRGFGYLWGAFRSPCKSSSWARKSQGGDVSPAGAAHSSPEGNETMGSADTSRFDSTEFLRDFYRGEERRESGRIVREYELTAEDIEIEVAPGVMYPAWAYNGQVPEPTLRATEGDRLRIVFKNQGTHPHTF